MFRSVHERRYGDLQRPSQYQHAAAGSLNLVQRLSLRGTLEGHSGCVNTVSFNEEGSILVSGSDDRHVVLWDWYTGQKLLAYKSGHANNIFQARIVPFTNNAVIVTCAADGQVRVGHLPRNGSRNVPTSLLAHHGSRAHKLALEPHAPTCFYSCGEDGRVFHYDLRCSNARQSLLICSSQDSSGQRWSRLQLHSIHCNPLRPWQFAVGGSDIHVRVYDQRRSLVSMRDADSSATSPAAIAEPVRKLCPTSLRTRSRNSYRKDTAFHVTCANFSRQGELLASYNDEDIYLFDSEGPAAHTITPNTSSVAHCLSLRKRQKWRVPQPGSSHLAEEPGPSASDAPREAQPCTSASPRETPSEEDPCPLPWSDNGSVLASGRRLSNARQAAGVPSGEGNAAEPERQVHRLQEPHASSHMARLEELSPTAEGGSAEPRTAAAAETLGAIPELCDISEDNTSDASSAEEDVDDSREGSGDYGSGSETSDSGSYMIDYGEDDTADERYAKPGPHDFRKSRQLLKVRVSGLIRTQGAEAGALRAVEQLLDSAHHSDSDEAIPIPSDYVAMRFTGHRNCRTVKGVSFLGERDEYVMSGSDDGHIYIWSKRDGRLRQWLRGDTHVVNCLEPNPAHPMSFATSGIEDNIKLWTPTASEMHDVPHAASQVMSRNEQNRSMYGSSSRASQILLRLQSLYQQHEERVPRQDQPAATLESGVSETARAAMRAHTARLHSELEQEAEDSPDGSSPRHGCTIS